MQIARFFGIPLYLHWSWFLLIAIVSIFNGPASLLTLLGVFFFVILHEYGHCFAARYYGLEATDITLSAIGGMARISSLGDKLPWYKEFVIVLAGPLVNLVICIIVVLLASLINEELMPWWVQVIAKYMFILNAILFIFNLLPIYPMDGGRVLRASLVGILQDYKTATILAVRIGQVLACGMVVLAILVGNPLMVFIFLLVCLLAQTELLAVKRQVSLEHLQKYLSQKLDRPELANATLPQLITALEDVDDEKLQQELNLDELLPTLKQHLEQQNQ